MLVLIGHEFIAFWLKFEKLTFWILLSNHGQRTYTAECNSGSAKASRRPWVQNWYVFGVGGSMMCHTAKKKSRQYHASLRIANISTLWTQLSQFFQLFSCISSYTPPYVQPYSSLRLIWHIWLAYMPVFLHFYLYFVILSWKYP